MIYIIKLDNGISIISEISGETPCDQIDDYGMIPLINPMILNASSNYSIYLTDFLPFFVMEESNTKTVSISASLIVFIKPVNVDKLVSLYQRSLLIREPNDVGYQEILDNSIDSINKLLDILDQCSDETSENPSQSIKTEGNIIDVSHIINKMNKDELN